MPNGNTPNIGDAIGISGKFIDRTPLVVQEMDRRRKEEEAIDAAAKRAASKSQLQIEKYRDDLGKWSVGAESGIHPVYHEKVAAMAEDMMQHFNAEREKNQNYNPSYDNVLNQKKFDFKQETDKDRQSTKNIVRDLGIKANDAKNKFDVNEQLLNSLNVSDYSDFVKNNGGSDYYAIGLNKAKPAVLGWTKDAALWAGKMKGLYVKNSDGSKTINPKLFDEQWENIKNDPAAEWVKNADAVNQSLGYNPEQSEAQVKQYVMNLLPNQAAPDKSTGAGTGTKAKYEFSSPEAYKHPLSTGKTEDVLAVTVTKKGGGVLPADVFTNKEGQSLMGHPTGKITKSNSGEVKMDLAVPNKSITSSSQWKDMDDDERQKWLDKTFQEDPNKFEKISVPLNVDFNKNKFEASYGKTIDTLFGQKESKTKEVKAEADEKVVVEKGGKKYKLPKSQLAEAQKQGYKLSK